MSINEEVELVYHQLLDELNHPYVHKILPKPSIDRDKLMIYYLMFRNIESRVVAGACAKSIMVAEIGLGTHETMTVRKLDEKDSVKKRQLTVLSGDFYSALYYYSLARQSKLDVVKWVAQAIQVFNARKCDFSYSKYSLDWTQTVEAVKKIESALVAKIAVQLGHEHFIPYLSDFFLIKRLVVERKIQDAPDYSGYFSRNTNGTSVHFVEKLDSEIKMNVSRFFEVLKKTDKHSELLSQVLEYLNGRMGQIAELR
ncbi:heptaprenyl diphosphate synthase component 1 [Sporolactobacillus laevolacticus]|uniref:Heptaprenyl diphosphate synthase n=1 Tax=Sporolactobacillus laevolacticus DSM 442 TaxID=1395513 RepID=V6IYI1_9BACL|nr:heptaprenyl diphosphate synthase component 1 [Sporolactobacillus laevolacticus]EST11786.1 hypothetical protein P343_10690 [Sporolactobacillus laevolacticus DSM 442]